MSNEEKIGIVAVKRYENTGDNGAYIAEEPIEEWLGETEINGHTYTTAKGMKNDESLTVDDYLYKDYGIFKLTPRECLRLMAVRDQDIDRILSTVSNSQAYKQAGNSIVVTVLMALFSQLNIKGVTPWNELTQEQREELIEANR